MSRSRTATPCAQRHGGVKRKSLSETLPDVADYFKTGKLPANRSNGRESLVLGSTRDSRVVTGDPPVTRIGLEVRPAVGSPASTRQSRVLPSEIHA